METPSSTRRITRSHTRAGLINSATSTTNTSRRTDDSEKNLFKTKQKTAKQDRSALFDITNDSPIVGLASGNLQTPISSAAKQRSNCCKRTPSSGEALLRSQVETLLQRVEEEAVISKFCLESEGRSIPKNLNYFLNSPAGLLAPTPANTPQIFNFSATDVFESLGSVSPNPIEDKLNIPQIFDEKNHAECGSESEKDLISRTLFEEFSDKFDYSDCSSVVTYQGTGGVEEEDQGKIATVEEDDASVWSIQVNASTRDEDDDEEDETIEDEFEEGNYDEEGEDEAESLLLDELCEEISKMNVEGKHTRFVYNSDDELMEDERLSSAESSSDVLCLN